MTDDELQQTLDDEIAAGIADGLNDLADQLLLDIEQHVAVRSGRLRDSYSVVKRATPADLGIVIDSPETYRVEHYPYTPEAFQKKPGGIFDESSPDIELAQLAETLIEQAIRSNLDAS